MLVWLHWPQVPNTVLIFLSGIELALIAWAGGPRIAQYIGPQIGKLGNAIAAAKRSDEDITRGWQSTNE